MDNSNTDICICGSRPNIQIQKTKKNKKSNNNNLRNSYFIIVLQKRTHFCFYCFICFLFYWIILNICIVIIIVSITPSLNTSYLFSWTDHVYSAQSIIQIDIIKICLICMCFSKKFYLLSDYVKCIWFTFGYFTIYILKLTESYDLVLF